MKFTAYDIIARVEHKIARRWVRGAGKDAEFEEDSQGWWAVFRSCPASMYLGPEEPNLKAGDCVKLTMEKVKS